MLLHYGCDYTVQYINYQYDIKVEFNSFVAQQKLRTSVVV